MEVLYVTPFLVGLALMVFILSGDESIEAPAGPYPPASAEHLAKALRRRGLICVAVTGAVVTYGLVNEDMVSMMGFSSLLYVIAIGGAIRRWFEATRALAALARGATATRHGNVVFVSRDDATLVLRAPRGLVDRARARGVPEARL
jgi:hypothetical protein